MTLGQCPFYVVVEAAVVGNIQLVEGGGFEYKMHCLYSLIRARDLG